MLDSFESSEAIKKIVENLDFSKIDFAGMTIEQKEAACNGIYAEMGFADANNAIDFMKRVNTLVPTLENTVMFAGLTDLGLVDKYKDLINEIDKPTVKTLEWLASYPIDFELSPNNCELLFKSKQFDKYVIAKTLYDKEFYFDKELIDISIYISVFNNNYNVFSIMSKNEEFLRYIVENKLYIGMNKTRLKVLYAVEQNSDLLVYILDNLDRSEKDEYFNNDMPDINEDESKKFIDYIRTGKNFLKIETAHTRKIIHSKLNQRYKAVYTRHINEMYTKEENKGNS